MEKLKYNTPFKIIVVLLSFVFVLSFILSAFSVCFMFANDFYTRNKSDIEKSVMEKLAEKELYNAQFRYSHEENLNDYYSDKNVFVTVTLLNGDVVFSNYNNEKILSEVSGDFIKRYYCDVSNKDYFTTDSEIMDDNIKLCSSENLIMKIIIPQKMQFTDRFFIINKAVKLGYDLRFYLIIISLFSFMFSAFSIYYLVSSSGFTKGNENISLGFFDKIPYDIFIAFFVTLFSCMFAYYDSIIYFKSDVLLLIVNFIFYVITYFSLLWILLTTVKRIKLKCLIKKTFLYFVYCFMLKIFKKIFGFTKYILKGIPYIIRSFIISFIIVGFNLLFILFFFEEAEYIFTLFIINLILFFVFSLFFSVMFSKIIKGGENIASGDLETKTDTKYMFGTFKKFAESLNNINDGLANAIEEKLKSERMKTELITNVSHDIKTPLTSIINYTDLIAKEKSDNPKISEYTEVLNRQSLRLKKLIEDLVEASKASTGNLDIETSLCDISVLLTQAVAEYEERLNTKKLEIVADYKSVYAYADGRRLWRVIDNLMSNICKYSFESTRVYIDAFEDEKNVYISFKNISSNRLNIKGEELTERFVRGDKARNTEGSGLGLSIAKSLMELQGGKLNIETDGDLFKAVISLKKNEENG